MLGGRLRGWISKMNGNRERCHAEEEPARRVGKARLWQPTSGPADFPGCALAIVWHTAPGKLAHRTQLVKFYFSQDFDLRSRDFPPRSRFALNLDEAERGWMEGSQGCKFGLELPGNTAIIANAQWQRNPGPLRFFPRAIYDGSAMRSGRLRMRLMVH